LIATLLKTDGVAPIFLGKMPEKENKKLLEDILTKGVQYGQDSDGKKYYKLATEENGKTKINWYVVNDKIVERIK
jgi:hypothetical protein